MKTLTLLIGLFFQEELPRHDVEQTQLNNYVKKATLDVRLYDKATEKQLTKLAYYLKRTTPGYANYFISYYLPDMPIGSGAWATSHFTPNLEIKIQGIDKVNEKKLTGASNPVGSEQIGKWYDSRPYVESTLIIYKLNGKLKLRQIFKDGSFSDKSLTQSGSKYIYSNDFGEFLKIESDGNLGWYSENGRFAMLRKIN